MYYKHLENMWEGLKRVQSDLGLDDQKMAFLMGMHSSSVYSGLKRDCSDIPLDCMINISELIGVDEFDLAFNRIDFDLAREYFYNNSVKNLKEEYRKGEGSLAFSLKNFCSVATQYGIRRELFKKLQISSAHFLNPNARISIKALQDCINFLNKLVPTSSFYQVGVSNAKDAISLIDGKNFFNRNWGPIGNFEMWVSHQHYFETNWNYKIVSQRKDESIIIHGRPTEKLLEEQKGNPFNSLEFNLLRSGYVGGLMNVCCELPDSNFTINQHILDGKDGALFKVDYKNIHSPRKRKVA